MTQATVHTAERLGALMEREMRARYAAGGIGYHWTYLSPALWIAFVVVLFRLLERSPPIHVGPEIFVATGILPYLIFRQTVSSLSRAVPANRHLQYIRPVSISDILLSVSALEWLNAMAVAAVIFVAVSVTFGAPLPAMPSAVLTSLTLAWLLGAGVGRLVAVIGLISDSFARAVPILLRPLFWLSGIFYTATELPGAVQQILWFSPLLHITEIGREGYFLGYVSPVSNMLYPLTIAVLFWLLSIPVEQAIRVSRRARHRI